MGKNTWSTCLNASRERNAHATRQHGATQFSFREIGRRGGYDVLDDGDTSVISQCFWVEDDEVTSDAAATFSEAADR